MTIPNRDKLMSRKLSNSRNMNYKYNETEVKKKILFGIT